MQKILLTLTLCFSLLSYAQIKGTVKDENGKLKAQEVPKEKRDGKALMKGILNRIKGN